jgi:hypothetical protein
MRVTDQQAKPVAWHVVDEQGGIQHAATWPQACHEHINDAINEHDLEEASRWIVRPVYANDRLPALVAMLEAEYESRKVERPTDYHQGFMDGLDFAIDRAAAAKEST